MLFSDLSGSTRLAASLEAEIYAEVLAGLRQSFEAVVAHHGGIIVRIDGDGFLVIFGYPRATGNDGRRAVEAALDLHDAVRSFWHPGLMLHSGIHSGLVLLNPGDIVRGRFEMLGEATSIASRLAGLAGGDEILVSEASIGADRHFFITGERHRLTIRGRDQPIAAFKVIGRSAVATNSAARAKRGLAPFVGRTPERAQLERELDRAIARYNRIVVIVGPAGVGKTRLSAAFLARAAAIGCHVHRAYCEAYLGAEPMQPILQLLRSMLDLEPTTTAEDVTTRLSALGLAEHAPVLLRLFALGGVATTDVPASVATVASATAALCAALAGGEPLILFIDDWQSADDSSRQILDAICGLPDLGIFVLLAARTVDDIDQSMSKAKLLNLSPFSAGEAATTIASLLPDSDPFQVAQIVEDSGGNALFIEELCHSLANGSNEDRPEGGYAWLDALIESRFARLTDAAATVVRAAAVIGKVVPAWLLETVTGHGETDPLVIALADADFLYPGDQPGTLIFKHGITRNVIYNSVGLRERRRLHHEVAAALQERSAAAGAEDFYEALAYHYAAGGDPAAAAPLAELAGDKARLGSALDRAQRQYRAALAALDELPVDANIDRRWWQVFRRYILVSLFDPSREQLPVYRRALARAEASGDAAAIARAEYWLGCFYYPLGDSRESLAHCTKALPLAVGMGDTRLVTLIRATMGQAAAAMGSYSTALELLDDAVAGPSPPGGRPQSLVNTAYSKACKGFVLADLGRFPESEACFTEAIAAVHDNWPEAEASLVGQRGVTRIWAQQFDAACEDAATAERIAGRIRLRYTYAMARAIGSYARWSISGTAGDARALVEATGWLEAGDRNQFISLNYGWLTEVMLASGRVGEMRLYAARALHRARCGDRLGEAAAYCSLARAIHAEDPRRAARYLALARSGAAARQSAHDIAATERCAAELARADKAITTDRSA